MAHGLVLRMKDYVEKLDTKKELSSRVKEPAYLQVEESEESSEVVQIITSWLLVTKNSKNSKMEFFSLLRQTLLFILSSGWEKCTKRNDLLHAFRSYYQKFSTITKNVEAIYNAVLQLSNNPWNNSFFNWEDLSVNNLNINEKSVQSYFRQEPEEIVLARCQSLVLHKKLPAAMCLAKMSFLYHSRVRKTLAQPDCPLPLKSRSGLFLDQISKGGHASIDWFISILERLKSLPLISRELCQFTCHEAVEIICRVKKNQRLKKFTLTLIQVFVLKDLLKPSKYCCTKKLFSLFCLTHKELNSSEKDITESAKKIVALYAPNSSHLYLFVDALWEQFGLKFNSLIQLYAELFVRGLTADINYLEAAKNSDLSCDIGGMETHIAFIFAKLSSLFSNSSEEAARECMFSAFSLKPSKARLLFLKSLNHRIQNKQAEVSDSCNSSDLAFRDCTCSRICNGYCRISTSDHNFVHPLLKKGIRNISYSLVKDLVCVLESVRSIKFQYNLFSWSDGIPSLCNHLTSGLTVNDVNDTSDINDIKYQISSEENSNSVTEIATVDVLSNKLKSPQALVKRKTSDSSNKSNFLDVGANIEIPCNDNANKKIKISDPVRQTQTVQDPNSFSHGTKLKVHDAIEKVIRMSLSDKMLKEHSQMFTAVNTLNVDKGFSSVDFNAKEDEFTPYQQQSNVKQKEKLSLLSPELSGFVQHELQKANELSSLAQKQNYSTSQVFERPSVVMKADDSFPEEKYLPQQSDIKSPYSVQNANVRTLETSQPVRNPNAFKHSLCNDEPHVDNFKHSNYLPRTYDQKPQELPLVKQNISESLNRNQSALNLSSRQLEVMPKGHLQTPQRAVHVPVNLKYSQNNEIQINDSGSVSKMSEIPTYQSMKESNQSAISQFPIQISSESNEKTDRNSVIQHTMQHLGIKIPNQLSVSLNSNTAQQLKNISQSNHPNLSPFKIKVPTKNIPKNNNIITANLVITRQPGSSTSTAQSAQSINTSLDKREVITIPGILASPSVIKRKPSWETPSVYDNVEYKKVMHSTKSTVKETFAHSYQNESSGKMPKELVRKTEVTKKETVYQIYKTKQMNRDNYSNKQRWSVTNHNDFSTKNISATATTQSLFSPSYHNTGNFATGNATFSCNNSPVYKNPATDTSYSSKPTFEAPSNCSYSYKNNAETNSANLSELKSYSSKDTNLTKSKLFRLDPYARPSTSNKEGAFHPLNLSFALNNQSINSNNSVSPILKASLSSTQRSDLNFNVAQNNFISESRNSNYRIPKKVYKNNLLTTSSPHCSSTPSSTTNSHVYSTLQCDTPQSSTSPYDPTLYSSPVLLEDDRGVVVFKAANTVLPSSQQTEEQSITKTCCSPLEVNPCQSCSVSTKSNILSHESANKQHRDFPAKMGNPTNQIQDVPKDGNAHRIRKSQFEEPYALFHDPSFEKFTTCSICSVKCTIAELKMHIENFHPHKVVKRRDGRDTNSFNFEIPSQDTTSCISAKELLEVNFDPKILKNMPEEVLKNAQNQSDLNVCENFMDNTPLEEIAEYLSNVDSSGNYADDSYKFSDMLKGDLQDNILTDFENNDAITANKAEKFNMDASLVENNLSDCNSNLDDMLNFLNTTTNLPEEISQCSVSFQADNYESGELIKAAWLENEPDDKPKKPKMKKNLYCKVCLRKYTSRCAIRRHIKQFHPDVNEKETIGSLSDKINSDISGSSINVSVPYEARKKDIETNRAPNITNFPKNSERNSAETFDFGSQHGRTADTYAPHFNKSTNFISDFKSDGIKNLNNPAVPSAGKKLRKAALKACEYCGKFLSVTYLRQHIMRFHLKMSSSNISLPATSPIYESENPSSISGVNKPLLSLPELQENIDSNTCLSVSDAFNHNQRYSDPNPDLKNVANNHQSTNEFCSIGRKPDYKEEPDLSFQEEFSHSVNNSHSTDLQRNYIRSCEPNQDTTGDNYTCHLCLRKYTSQTYLNKHLRTYHGILDTDEFIKSEPFDSSFGAEHPSSEIPSSPNIGNVSVSHPKQENSEIILKESSHSSDIQLAAPCINNEHNFQGYQQNNVDFLNTGHLRTTNNYESSNSYNQTSECAGSSFADTFHQSNGLVIDQQHSIPQWQSELDDWRQNSIASPKMNIKEENFPIENEGNFFSAPFIENQTGKGSEVSFESVDRKTATCETQHLNSGKNEDDLKLLQNHKQNSSCRSTCHICSKTFCTKAYLKKHMQSKHQGQADIRDLQFQANPLLLDDKKVTLPTSSECEKQDPYSNVKDQHPNQPISTNSNQVVQNSDKVTAENPFDDSVRSTEKMMCHFCHKTYSTRGNLKIHLKNLHRYVLKKRKIKSYLKSMIKKNILRNKKIQCNVCLKVLKKGSISTHMKLHSGISTDDHKQVTVSGTVALSSLNFYNENQNDLQFIKNLANKTSTAQFNYPAIMSSSIEKIVNNSVNCTLSAPLEHLAPEPRNTNTSQFSDIDIVKRSDVSRAKNNEGVNILEVSLKTNTEELPTLDFGIDNFQPKFTSNINQMSPDVSSDIEVQHLQTSNCSTLPSVTEVTSNRNLPEVSSDIEVQHLQTSNCSTQPSVTRNQMSPIVSSDIEVQHLQTSNFSTPPSVTKVTSSRNQMSPDVSSDIEVQHLQTSCSTPPSVKVTSTRNHMSPDISLDIEDQHLLTSTCSMPPSVTKVTPSRNHMSPDVSSDVEVQHLQTSNCSTPPSVDVDICNQVYHKIDNCLENDSLYGLSHGLSVCDTDSRNESSSVSHFLEDNGDILLKKFTSPALLNSNFDEVPSAKIDLLSYAVPKFTITSDIETQCKLCVKNLVETVSQKALNKDKNNFGTENDVEKQTSYLNQFDPFSSNTSTCGVEIVQYPTNKKSKGDSEYEIENSIQLKTNSSNSFQNNNLSNDTGESLNCNDLLSNTNQIPANADNMAKENSTHSHNLQECLSLFDDGNQKSVEPKNSSALDAKNSKMNSEDSKNNASQAEFLLSSGDPVNLESVLPENNFGTHKSIKQSLPSVKISVLKSSDKFPTEKSFTDNHSSVLENSKILFKTCRLCHKIFKTMTMLSKHLKIVHNIPLLKKQKTPNLKAEFSERDGNKLPPPLLPHHQNYDLNSVSEFTNMSQNSQDKDSCSMIEDTNNKESPNFAKTFDVSEKHVDDNYSIASFENEKPLLPNMSELPSDLIPLTLNCGNSSEVCDTNDRISPVKFSNDKSMSEQTTCLTPILPCIIKVFKNDRNTVVYQIDNSKGKSSNSAEDGEFVNAMAYDDYKKSLRKENLKHSRNFRSKFKRKNGATYSSTIACKTRPIRNSFFNRRKRFFPSYDKNKRLGYKLFQGKGAVRLKSKNRSKNHSKVLTFKYPNDVINFLKEHKQPVVRLTRLRTDSFSILANSDSIPVSDCGIKSDEDALEKFENTAVLNDAVKRPAHSVPKHFIDFESASKIPQRICNAQNSGEITVNQTKLKSKFPRRSTRTETTSVTIVLRKLEIDVNSYNLHQNSDNFTLNSNFVDNSLTPQKKFMQLPVLKECSVILNKLDYK